MAPLEQLDLQEKKDQGESLVSQEKREDKVLPEN